MLLFAGAFMLAYLGLSWKRHDTALAVAFAGFGLMLIALALGG
jgi:hypothetical protein